MGLHAALTRGLNAVLTREITCSAKTGDNIQQEITCGADTAGYKQSYGLLYAALSADTVGYMWR